MLVFVVVYGHILLLNVIVLTIVYVMHSFAFECNDSCDVLFCYWT